MSFFACPNSSRGLVRTAIRTVSSRAVSSPQPFTPARWLSGCAASRRDLVSKSWTCKRAAFTVDYPHQTRRTFFSDKTIRKYEDLPQDYRDQAGLPFRNLDLTDSEVLQVFGKGINGKRANHLLRILHGRRVAGTLEDPAFAVHTASFTKDQISRALQYLRKSVPVEEVMNAGLRAEDELAQMEADAEAAQNKTLEKTITATEESTKAPGPVYTSDPIYGHSKIDEIRARNVAKRKVREAQEEEERLAAEARGEVSGPLAKVNENGERQIMNPRIQEYASAAQSKLEAPPELKWWERVLPSATVVALVIGFLAAISSVYEEPADRYRLFPDISTATATLGAIVAVNVVIWAGWKFPPLWAAFNRYMIFVIATVKPISLFLAPFSHQKLTHLLVNMVPLCLVGSSLHEEIGRANFLTLYLACGATGFLGSLITYTARGWLTVTSLGASGATLGLLSAYFWSHRNDGFRIFGLPQDGVHGIVFLAMLCVPQLAAFGKTATMKVDLASHLTGMLMGILGVEYIYRSEGKNPEREVIEVIRGGKRADPPLPISQEG